MPQFSVCLISIIWEPLLDSIVLIIFHRFSEPLRLSLDLTSAALKNKHGVGFHNDDFKKGTQKFQIMASLVWQLVLKS